MFTHPDLLGFSVKQHMDDLMAEAEHSRLLTAALRRRKAARAAAREARHHVAAQVAPIGASVKEANLRTSSAGSPRDRFADDSASQSPSASGARKVSAADGSLSECEPRAAA